MLSHSGIRFALAAVLTCLLIGPPQAKAQDTEIKITVTKPQTAAATGAAPAPFPGDRPAVDVAILLDTSNSMDGLINQAKSQLWTIVQQFEKARKAGQTPVLRVAVFEYGNTHLPASEGYIRQVVGLTDNLDKVSEALFGLTTSGGDEYCGQVIQEAVKRLDWSQEPNGYKAIFVAGNEPFTQGSIDYRDACRQAIQAGVVVNTIHCGDYQAGVRGQWQDGASLAEGKFLNIDQDRHVVRIPCPQDEIIIRLNKKLNATYLWFGQREDRQSWARNQVAQDANAESAAGLPDRAAAKAGALYRNVGRDLVDTLQESGDAIATIPAENLPEPLQTLTVDERRAYVAKTARERTEIQQQIAELNRQREAFLQQARQKLAEEAGGDATLGDAVTLAVRDQLIRAGFQLQDERQTGTISRGLQGDTGTKP